MTLHCFDRVRDLVIEPKSPMLKCFDSEEFLNDM